MTFTNIIDAVMAGRDGDVGVQQAKIGDLLIDVLRGLRVTHRKEVTRRPVQRGFSVDVGVNDTPVEVEMDIAFCNPDFSPEGMLEAAISGSVEVITKTYREKVDELFAAFNEKRIVDATTHDATYYPLVIEEISPLYDNEEDLEGWVGTVRLVSFNNQGGDTAVDINDAETAATVAAGAL